MLGVTSTVKFLFAGVEAKWKAIQSGKEKVHTAQVLHILYSIPHSFEITALSLFLTHETFTTASIVLRPNVHLLSIEKDIAKFVEVDPAVDILNVKKNPILLIAQTIHAKKIIILPRRIFDDMVSEFDTEENNVVWLFHTSRCGSTLWAQIFQTVPGWTIISETQVMSHSFCHASGFDELDIDSFAKTKQFEDMVVAYIKCYLRLVPAKNSVLWRALGVMSEHMIPIIKKRFPKHKIMMVYRDVLPSAKSYHKVMGNMPIYEAELEPMLDDINNTMPSKQSRAFRLFWTSGYDPTVVIPAITKSQLHPNIFEFFMVLWGCRVKKMQEYQRNGIKIRCIKYDNLVDDPRLLISKVFRHVGVSVYFVDEAIKAMDRDSQAGLVFSKENKDHDPSWVRTSGAVQRCNSFLSAMGLPGLDSELVMNDML